MRRDRQIALRGVRRRSSGEDGGRRFSGEDGVALIVALMFVVLLSAIVIEYAYETQVEASLAANAKDDFQAYVAAKSAVATGLGLLEGDIIGDQVTGAVNSAANTVKNSLPVKNTSGQQQQAQPDTTPYDSLLDIWAQGMPPQPINDAEMQCTITDESGKINLNALFINETETNPVLEQAVRQLFQNLGFEEDPTDAILDWLDPDEDVRPNGAESEYYTSLETPYPCRNGPMDSIDELLLIKGITSQLFFDCTANAEQSTLKSMKEEKDRPIIALSDLFTVRGSPVGKVNVNTAPPEVLEALLMTSGGNPGAVDAILQIRAETPFQSVGDFSSQTGISAGTGIGAGTAVGAGAVSNAQPIRKAAGVADLSQQPEVQQSPFSQGTYSPDQRTGGQQNTSGQNTNQNTINRNQQPMGGQNIFDVKSDFFRIFGDGRSGETMVRIEAYVYRLPADAQGMGVPAGGSGVTKPGTQPVQTGKTGQTQNASATPAAAGSIPLETFRFLDWRVIK